MSNEESNNINNMNDVNNVNIRPPDNSQRITLISNNSKQELLFSLKEIVNQKSFFLQNQSFVFQRLEVKINKAIEKLFNTFYKTVLDIDEYFELHLIVYTYYGQDFIHIMNEIFEVDDIPALYAYSQKMEEDIEKKCNENKKQQQQVETLLQQKEEEQVEQQLQQVERLLQQKEEEQEEQVEQQLQQKEEQQLQHQQLERKTILSHVLSKLQFLRAIDPVIKTILEDFEEGNKIEIFCCSTEQFPLLPLQSSTINQLTLHLSTIRLSVDIKEKFMKFLTTSNLLS